MLQYGTYTHSNRVYTDHEVEVEPMPEILRKLVVERLVERGVFGEEKNEEIYKKKNEDFGGKQNKKALDGGEEQREESGGEISEMRVQEL